MKDEQEDKHRRKAVALRYDAQKDAAPVVKAKGAGYVADRIMELANEHDIPIQEDRDLTEILSKLDTGTPIPESLYKAVAEILAFVYALNKKHA